MAKNKTIERVAATRSPYGDILRGEAAAYDYLHQLELGHVVNGQLYQDTMAIYNECGSQELYGFLSVLEHQLRKPAH
ncbi:hypothetical protein [Variovorax sp. dw_308]|uniref:hypothetical protein n=1 Tax=Variovorax sp. dw_308 TaxID=2721546 RepID=UPI001C43C1B9|nr:hypothetical protein [Variovorax sp. dw_308]